MKLQTIWKVIKWTVECSPCKIIFEKKFWFHIENLWLYFTEIAYKWYLCRYIDLLVDGPYILFRKNHLKSQRVCTLSQKNVNISTQGLRILDLRAVLETSLNFTGSFRTSEWDLTTKYSSKKPWSWQMLKKAKIRKFCEG